MVREPNSPFHERPSQRLAALAERIAAVRGKAIACFGTMDLTLLGDDGRPTRMMQADQSLYLHPERPRIVGPSAMVVGRNHYPDIVLEVDRTTDVRRHKLQLYEAWGFPELWVDVPDESPRPAAGLRPGMTIYTLAGSVYETELERRAAMMRTLMIARGLEVAADFPLHEPLFREADVDDAAVAAMSCVDEEDFVARLRQASYR